MAIQQPGSPYYLFLIRMNAVMELKHLVLLLLLHHIVLGLCDPFPHRQHQSIYLEKATLLDFKSKMSSDSTSALANWNESTDVCDFTGVECNKWRLHVVRIQLNRTLIQGPLSPVLANLTGLRELDLSDNFLTSHIPPEFSKLWRLSILDLSGNHLHGQIPESLALLKDLVYLNLGSNFLVGQIPALIFHNCTLLGAIDISNNALSGKIPSQVGTYLPQLITLYIYLNHLHGEIPLWLSNSSFLVELDVEDNYITGELPTNIIRNMAYLEILHLSHNQLSSHNNNTNLMPFFVALSNCSELTELETAGMGLGGQLPPRIGRVMTQLSTIYLDNNMIFGPIPSHIANLRNLMLLDLSNNLLNGTVPDEFSQLPLLERLILSHNSLSGTIPPVIGNMSSMGLLDLSNNRLSGEIPSSIGDLSRVSEIYLHNNQLTGGIPSSLGRCINLNMLDLSYNRLGGEIPREISGILKIFLNLSNNQLQGSLPLELSKMDQVQEIDLSSNNLTGELIPQLSACIEVKLINLSCNSFRGQLPESYGDLENLETLDVSFNHLSGEIPSSLNKCTSLGYLNLSYNDFSGMVPSGGSFSRFTNLSFLGNPRLCGPISGHACPQRVRLLHSLKFLITVCVVSSILAFALTVCCVIGVRRIRGGILKSKSDDSSPVLRPSYPRITYRELSVATGDFDQERLVGSGSYGRVYRGVLRDGTVVAVKVLNLQTGNSTKSFDRECQVLKRIRHRNLMRIITACSLPDFKALVLPLMENGSLGNRLYPSSSSCDLSLIQRVNICSDIAEGMAYLHHHSPVKVIHCDLKPSNVLLNNDMTALVSDFGIARLVMTVGMGSTSGVDNLGGSTANMLCGSIGYIAPEYAFGSNASTKGDVYSFGVLVLEVVTRRRPTDEMFEGNLSLNRWVKKYYHGRAEKVIDSTLASVVRDQNPEVKNMWEVAIGELLELGLLCTQDSPSTRPTMLDVADDLNRLKGYLSGDTTATFTSSLGMSSSTIEED